MPDSSEPVLLEDFIAGALNRPGLIRLLGPSGSGKSVALRHLAAVLPAEACVLLREDLRPQDVGQPRLVIFAAGDFVDSALNPFVLELAPWTNDDALEYLLAKHRDRCGDILRRLTAARDAAALRGNPELVAMVLDRMAAEPDLTSAIEALRREARRRFPEPGALERAGEAALDSEFRLDSVWMDHLWIQAWTRRAGPGALPMQEFDLQPQLRFLKHPQGRSLLAAEFLASELLAGRVPPSVQDRPPAPQLVRETARVLKQAPCGAFESRMRSPDDQALLASIRLAMDPAWRPDETRAGDLQGALLAGARWSHLTLRSLRITEANLRGADLRHAVVDRLQADRATLANACLDRAWLELASFAGADLTGASLIEARLKGADFRSARLQGADFSGADLEGAVFDGLRLTSAKLRGARLVRAQLVKTSLAGMELPGAAFEGARLDGADLEGCFLPGANFRNACLRNTRLADVNLERANLFYADLRGATFHMGTTRSGLLLDAPPSEGTRTGFYSDWREPFTYQRPEDMRVANLRGADLRGARLDGTDFYLVDLRDARYTADQEAHFRSCGAILETPAE